MAEATRSPNRRARRRRLRARVLRAAATLSAIGLLAPAAASAALIPPPGPWPTDIAGATNPLAGTPSPFNGAGAGANADLDVWFRSGHQRRNSLTVTVGRDLIVRGHLSNRDTRHSIAGATVTLAAQNVYAPEWTLLTNLVTDRKGNFAAQVGPGYHRRLAAIYYPEANTASPVFSRRLLVRANSRVTLARPFHRRRAYRFDGQVSGGDYLPVPTSGLLIALQVRNRTGNWITARIAKTTVSGRFRIRYTFPTAARLTVRVLVPAQNGWALYAGHSPDRRIHPR
jgi:hypothetical protein